MKYINTAYERKFGEDYFFEHVMPEDFDVSKSKKALSSYFDCRGFKVSMMFADFYSSLNGVKSDKYLSMDIYYNYILPALNCYRFMSAYTDKSMFEVLFPGHKHPKTILRNMNGVWCRKVGCIVNDVDAVLNELVDGRNYIIKPTIDSCEGKGVELLRNGSVSEMKEQMLIYKENFIVQEKLEQHPIMSLFNESSLNTLRCYSYRSIDGVVHFLPKSTCVRFGGKGAIKDNMSAMGGSARVYEDGHVGDNVYHYKSLVVDSLSDSIGEMVLIPNFDKVKKEVVELHQKMPYFDLIGWDIAIDAQGNPVMIEYNTVPAVEVPQIVCGPLLEDYLDEVIDRISNPIHYMKTQSVKSFKEGYEFAFDINNNNPQLQ